MGQVMLWLVRRLKLGYEGLYPVLTLSLVFLTFGITAALNGSGFLAVYLAGIVLGNHEFAHKRSLLHFHDGLAWLMQITMFLTLGLLVFPSRLVPVMGVSLLIAACLMFVARPLSVFIGLLPSSLEWRQKLFTSWVGLRGAAPIILATFPLLAGLPQAGLIFNVIFFVVLTSVLLQGASLPFVAKALGVDAPTAPKRSYPIERVPTDRPSNVLNELIISSGSDLNGKTLADLALPYGILVVLISRGDDFLVPNGQTILQAGDSLLVLADAETHDDVWMSLGIRPSDSAG
jgi:potassium/hydrogen antiporter